MHLFLEYLWREPLYYFAWLIVVVFSITVHEFSHAWVSSRLGDDTARSCGFLSLNPMQVMGQQSIICLLLFGIAWGAVPVNPFAYRERWKPSLAAAAGPGANLVLAFLFVLLGTLGERFFGETGIGAVYCKFLLLASQANCLLFVFNMLPIPYLDGWAVLEPFVEPMRRLDTQKKGILCLALILALWITRASCVITFLSHLLNAVLIVFVSFFIR